MRLMLLMILVLLAGCAPTRVTLRNPYNGNVAECQPDPSISWDTSVALEVCAQRYVSFGYLPVGSY